MCISRIAKISIVLGGVSSTRISIEQMKAIFRLEFGIFLISQDLIGLRIIY